MVVAVPENRRTDLLPLFADHPYLHTVSEAFLREGIGEAFADALDEPTVALIQKDGIVFVAGDPTHPAAPQLLDNVQQQWLVIPPPGPWSQTFLDQWGEQLQSHDRVAFSSDDLDIEHLQNLQQKLPQGMTMEQLTAESVHELSDEAKQVILFVFASLEDFIERSIGFAVRDGDTMICSVFAGTPIYSDEFEMHGDTAPEYRNRGVGKACAARLIEHCLQQGITARCDADSELSAISAERLGFSQPETYKGYYWTTETPGQPEDS